MTKIPEPPLLVLSDTPAIYAEKFYKWTLDVHRILSIDNEVGRSKSYEIGYADAMKVKDGHNLSQWNRGWNAAMEVLYKSLPESMQRKLHEMTVDDSSRKEAESE